MKETRVAYRYAKSLVDLAAEMGVLDQANNDMKFIDSVCTENRALVVAMKNPVVGTDKKEGIIRSLFGGRISEFTLSLLVLLIKKHRGPVLFEVTVEFQRLYREIKGIKQVEVITTLPLSDDQRDGFRSILSNKSRSIELIEKTDESIIGGFVLKMDDLQVDESIRTKLSRIKNKFSEQVINY
jgi:F-type H+-transporting ATPase subunit delta